VRENQQQMAGQSEKGGKQRKETAQLFVIQLMCIAYLFFFLYRKYRHELGFSVPGSPTLVALLGSLGAFTVLPEAIGQKNYLGLPTSLRFLDGRVHNFPSALVWGLRVGGAAFAALAVGGLFYFPRAASQSFLEGWMDCLGLAVNALFLVPISQVYVADFEEADAKRRDPHKENIFALCLTTQFFASYSSRWWLTLIFVPFYAAYMFFSYVSGFIPFLGGKATAPAQAAGAAPQPLGKNSGRK
jgi:hypothetical protein